MKTKQIDFVITWVDGGDPAWRRERDLYSCGDEKKDRDTNADTTDDREERYRDWGWLKYWFRGVEKYAPWVRKIHFITWGHLPDWLDTTNPKLHIVRHEDYIPAEYLPTFNCNVLEANLHRIKGLSEQFVNFNDDVLLINEIRPEDFFRKGKPCDMLAFQPVVANPDNPVMSHLLLNNTLVLSKYFDKRENVRKQPWNYFRPGYPPLYFFYNMLELFFPLYTGFYSVHGPMPFRKKTFEELWEREPEILKETSSHKFRDKGDVTSYLFREWQKLKGEFHAVNAVKDFRYFDAAVHNKKLLSCIREQKAKMICINDGAAGVDFEKAQTEIHNALETILPEKSSFEKQDA